MFLNNFLIIHQLIIIILIVRIHSSEINLNEYEKYEGYLNYGEMKLRKFNVNKEIYEDILFKSKVEVLGEIFKNQIDDIKSNDKLDLIFLIDSSSSIGENNFDSEIKFVKKLLSDITVDFNHTRIAIITYSSDENIVSRILFFFSKFCLLVPCKHC